MCCHSKTSTFFVCTSCQAFFEQPLGKMVPKTSETSGHINSVFRTQAGPMVPDKCTECDSVLHVSGSLKIRYFNQHSADCWADVVWSTS